jgi:radical SAM superfamily enzyme YgiQ (UPF0313 family)
VVPETQAAAPKHYRLPQLGVRREYPMKALLVYPWFVDTYWSFRHALSLYGRRSFFPPLGLLTISALLPSHWERRLVDLNVKQLTLADIQWADAVFVSAMHVQRNSLQQIVELAKAQGKTVVVGGPYASICPDQLGKADHIFIGEAENTFAEFARDLERGEARRIYKVAERPALSCSPIPDFRLVDLKQYSSMSVQYSRGCPFNCEFCDIIEIYGRIPRTKSNEQMLSELDGLAAVGWRESVFIVDDNFIGNKKNVRQLLPELAEWSRKRDYPFSFTTEASVNLADDDELLQLMRDAGFSRVFIGIETPVEESLKLSQKGQNTRRNLLDSIRKIQSYGLEVMAGFIVGFDNDPEDIFERQINFIRESAIPCSIVSLLSAIPETQLWRRLEREGRLLGFDHTGNNTDGFLNFIPKMDKERLIEGYKLVLRTIYDPREYYQRSLDCLAKVNRIGAPEPGRTAVNLNDLLSVFRIALRLGVLDQSRLEFWRYMRRVFLEQRDKLGQGIVLAAMGFHFRRLMEEC